MPKSKHANALAAAACALCVSGVAVAQEAWFLLPHRGPRDSLVALTAQGEVKTIAELGFVMSYGDSQDAMAFLSGQVGDPQLDVISNSSRHTLYSFLVHKHAIQKMPGAERSIVLTNTFAYFAVFHAPPTNPPLSKNKLGGIVDFAEVSLRTGEETFLPLPADCESPKVVDFNGIPLVFSWNSYGVWRFDPSSKSLKRLVSKEDIADVLSQECRAFDCGGMRPDVWAGYVGVPGAGVFRMSQMGTLDEVLDVNLAPVHAPRPTLKLSLHGREVELSPGTFDGRPAIAVLDVADIGGTRTVTYVDARSLSVRWKTSIPQANGPGLPQSSPSRALYVNSQSNTVEEMSPTGIHSLWNLNLMAPLLAPPDGPGDLENAYMVWMTIR
jgi:hypothetical protein